MSCERYLDLISARMDGESTLLEESQLSAHLRDCPRCRAIAEDLNGIRSAFSQTETVQVPETLARQVMEQIQEETKTRHAADRQRRRTIRQLAGLAACLVLCVGAVRFSGLEFGNGGLQAAGETGLSMVRKGEHLAEVPVPAAEVADTQKEPQGTLDFSSTPVPSGSTLAKDPAHYFFCNDQYIRVYGKTPETPCACILGSVQSLSDFIHQFPDSDLTAQTKQYDADYFKTKRLLAVVLEEPSGSNRHQLASQGLLRDNVTVIRQIPEVGTCDMASWLILAEVDTMFDDGEILRVELVKQELTASN